MAGMTAHWVLIRPGVDNDARLMLAGRFTVRDDANPDAGAWLKNVAPYCWMVMIHSVREVDRNAPRNG